MNQLRVVPIVEGHGEVGAVRILLERIWYELLQGEYIEVLRPIRRSRSRIVKTGDLIAALQLAELRLHEREDAMPQMVLLLLDANGDAPCVLGPQLVSIAHREMPHLDFACVLAKEEYETWFVASAESLDRYLDSSDLAQVPEDPEGTGAKKGWIERRMIGHYSETVDQPAMTATLDLGLCRRRSPSFDKLCRELERRVERHDQPS